MTAIMKEFKEAENLILIIINNNNSSNSNNLMVNSNNSSSSNKMKIMLIAIIKGYLICKNNSILNSSSKFMNNISSCSRYNKIYSRNSKRKKIKIKKKTIIIMIAKYFEVFICFFYFLR
jgi:hypothetical protein